MFTAGWTLRHHQIVFPLLSSFCYLSLPWTSNSEIPSPGILDSFVIQSAVWGPAALAFPNGFCLRNVESWSPNSDLLKETTKICNLFACTLMFEKHCSVIDTVCFLQERLYYCIPRGHKDYKYLFIYLLNRYSLSTMGIPLGPIPKELALHCHLLNSLLFSALCAVLGLQR